MRNAEILKLSTLQTNHRTNAVKFVSFMNLNNQCMHDISNEDPTKKCMCQRFPLIITKAKHSVARDSIRSFRTRSKRNKSSSIQKLIT